MTPEQIVLITLFWVRNAEASNLDACNPANIERIAKLDRQLTYLRREIEATGLTQNATGEWK